MTDNKKDHNVHVTLFLLQLGLVSFLLIVDAFIPSTALPKEGPLAGDRIGNFSILAFVWTRSRLEQFLLSFVFTLPFIFVWRILMTWGDDHGHGHGSHGRGDEKKPFLSWCNLATFIGVSGWTFRQWAKFTLDRFFTYQLTKPTDIVESGPYKWLVHPGYAGTMLNLFGLLMLLLKPLDRYNSYNNNNNNSQKIIGVYKYSYLYYLKIPILIALVSFGYMVLMKRIDDEEEMLIEHFGERWIKHVSQRWRLVPFVP